MNHFNDTVTKNEIVDLGETKSVNCAVCSTLTPWPNAIWHNGKQHCSYVCVEVTKDREKKDEAKSNQALLPCQQAAQKIRRQR